MNFDFSEEQRLLRDQARRFLDDGQALGQARQVMETDEPFDREMWSRMAELGWMGTVVPDTYGGAGMSREDLCVIAEELGRTLAPTPFSSSVYLATEAILLAGDEAQRDAYLPRLAAGETIGTVAIADGVKNLDRKGLATSFSAGVLNGVKTPVPDGDVADFAVVLADAGGGAAWVLVDLAGDGVARDSVETVDPSRNHARLNFTKAPAELLGPTDGGWELTERLFDQAAVLFAFEQLGGAQACLDMAVEYAKERYAFGRPIGSFQAIKHKLADVYTATELARSNAYYGAWALAEDAPDLPVAAAAARVAAIQAYELASGENIQTPGGMGFTWELDCHLYYRRAKLLALAIGGERRWKDKLISRIEARNVAA